MNGRYRRWLGRKIHPSWLLAAASLGVCVGVIAAGLVAPGLFGATVWLLVGVALLVVGGLIQRRWAVVVIVVGGLLIGLWRGGISQHELTVYRNLVGHQLTLTGTIGEDPDVGKHGETTLRLENVTAHSHELPGKIWVSLADKKPLWRGDKVTVNGKLAEGFASFGASMYRAALVRAERPTPIDPALSFRHYFDQQVRAQIAEPQSSLGLGFLLGERRGLPENLESALRTAGLMHIVVASGYNLTILVRLARRAFAKLSKFLAAFSGGLLIAGFIAVTGVSPSMSRAGLIAGLSLLAWYYGRRIHPLVMLPFAASVTLLVNPSYGWNDLGWALSFAAFAGVMVLAPLAHAYFFGDRKPGTLRQIIGETVAAQLVTLPILLASFGVFSVVGLVANILILPLVPLAMLLTFLAGVLNAAVPLLAPLAGEPAQLLLTYMTTVAELCAQPEWAQVSLQIAWWQAVILYCVLIAACCWMWRATRYNFRTSSIID